MSPRHTQKTDKASKSTDMPSSRNAPASKPEQRAASSDPRHQDGNVGNGREEDLSLIGQEMMPASHALVPIQESGTKVESGVGSEETKKSPVPKTPMPIEDDPDRFTTPTPGGVAKKDDKPTPSSSKSMGRVATGKDVQGGEQSNRDTPKTPLGPPVALQPPGMMGPLFSQEQLDQFRELQATAPLLQPTRDALPPGMMQGTPPSFGSSWNCGEFHRHGLYDVVPPGYDTWRAEMERMVAFMSVQLRASQHENVKLRGEIKELIDRRDDSRYGTPEEKSVLKGLSRFEEEEDGARAQQDEDPRRMTAEEDGLESRQESEAEEEQSEQESEEEVAPQKSPKKPKRKQDQTITVMLKLMEGMQELQRRMISQNDEHRGSVEVARPLVDLPRLPEWTNETAPIDFNDWLVMLNSHMSDLSQNSEVWWQLMIQTARSWYSAHMKLSPIEPAFGPFSKASTGASGEEVEAP